MKLRFGREYNRVRTHNMALSVSDSLTVRRLLGLEDEADISTIMAAVERRLKAIAQPPPPPPPQPPQLPREQNWAPRLPLPSYCSDIWQDRRYQPPPPADWSVEPSLAWQGHATPAVQTKTATATCMQPGRRTEKPSRCMDHRKPDFAARDHIPVQDPFRSGQQTQAELFTAGICKQRVEPGTEQSTN